MFVGQFRGPRLAPEVHSEPQALAVGLFACRCDSKNPQASVSAFPRKTHSLARLAWIRRPDRLANLMFQFITLSSAVNA